MPYEMFLTQSIIPQFLLVTKDGKVLHRWTEYNITSSHFFDNANTN
jgi:hypothetical protein